MARDVIMPALGMAQETGLILAWHKKPGDAVSTGDVLMEVETDKAAMEVEAQADGFLVELRAAEGEEVPVGTVIATIAASLDEIAKPAVALTEPAESAEAASPPSAPKAQPPEPEIPPPPGPVAPAETGQSVRPAMPANGKILASPKAKRLAAERGIDLQALARAGYAPPYRTADLDRAETARLPVSHPGTDVFQLRARASASTDAFDGFCAWLKSEQAIVDSAVIAAFAAGSFRSATGHESICVRVAGPGLAACCFTDPDRSGLRSLRPDADNAAPDICVFDLTGSRLSDAEMQGRDVPTITIGRENGRFQIALAASSSRLGEADLIDCLDGFAGRLEEPLRQLL